jgi:putative ABC transport system substrate-binding protein
MKTWFPAFLIAVVLALAEGFAGAQQTTKIPRIGFLDLDDPTSPVFESFRQGLRELGYVEGQNIIIEPRFAYGSEWRLNGLAGELVGLKVNVIVTGSLSNFSRGSMTIPIVMAYTGDPVAAGTVASFERPGGNVTGIGGLAAGLGGKWLELLKETVPEIRRVGVLYTRTLAGVSPIMMKELEATARSLGVVLQPAEVKFFNVPFGFVRGAVGNAFTLATRGQADGLMVLRGRSFDEGLSYIADLALQRRLPGISWHADFAEAGGLMAYGANRLEQFRRAAYFVDKILKGAKPAELPVELPKKFELVINLKTAKEIGVKVPDKMLTWADRIIK